MNEKSMVRGIQIIRDKIGGIGKMSHEVYPFNDLRKKDMFESKIRP